MKKFNIGWVVIVLFALVTSSCEKDDYVEPNFPTKSFSTYASFFEHSTGANVNPTLITTNKMESVKDLSNGYLSHQWSFWKRSETSGDWSQMDKNEGVQFIKTNSQLGWENLTDYSPYIDDSINPTNDLSALSFIFEEGGAYRLKIHNTYDKRIRYMYYIIDPVSGASNQYIDAEPMGDGNYEIIQEFQIEVFESLVPTAKIYSDAAYTKEVDLSQKITIDGVECSEITINAGESLYINDATGENEDGISSFYTAPTSRTWVWTCTQEPDNHIGSMPAVEPISSTVKQQKFTFDDKGNYQLKLRVVRSRPSEYSNKFPTADVSQTVPIIVYVR